MKVPFNATAIGQNLRALRLQKGLTQEELARRAGITSRWLGKLERGQGSMTIQTCLYLCAVLECRPNDLLL